MTTKLTAREAHAIAAPVDVESIVGNILSAVRKAAEAGKTSVAYRGDGFGSGLFYCSEEKYPEWAPAVFAELRSLGYTIDIGCREAQFVDMWLNVDWSKA